MTGGRHLAEWLALQEGVHGTAIDLGLDRVRAVAQRLELLPFAPRSIIVAGTNGKGSTVACLTQLLRAQGATVGSFTSPHLLRYNERIRVNGAEVSDTQIVAAFEAIEAARGDITLTFFEFNALAALWIFAQRGVQFAVLEVGLGGRLDAVNIVDAEASVVCSIGLDHADWLGSDLDGIAREKAGVFRRDQWVVLSDPSMRPAVELEAQRIGARVLKAGRDFHWQQGGDGDSWSYIGAARRFDSLRLPALRGQVQLANAAASITTLLGLGVDLQAAHINRALPRLRLPGRFQIIAGPVEWILDVAHNEPAAAVLAGNLRARACAGRTLAVAGILGDKDVDAIARELAPVVDQWVLCGLDVPRGLDASALRGRSPVFQAAHEASDVRAGMELAAQLARPGDRIVVCGSFLTVTPALCLLGLY
ncbi:MAG: bifunctional tetrahydrofolate synthase/dihydrofolate synthase [Nevskiaceae bacterium]|jgi:dihydrofolate synthase/folylpolyglutamate synthase|nr:bifunctional tetrahydrofolate synthase/dihydrofolate synthase [Nevskiaceae bacterium]